MKISIILTGHNRWSEGLLSAFELINGGHDNSIVCINFSDQSEPLEKYQKKISETVQCLSENCDEIWIATDIVGGYPFQQAVLLSMNQSKIRVFGGINLIFLLTVWSEQDSYENGSDLAKMTIESARKGIEEFENQRAILNKDENNTSEGGI